MRFRLLLTVAAFGLLLKTAPAQTPWFEAQEIDAHVGDICYAVTASDVNGDRKTDIVAITEDAVVWYENPHWRKHDVVRQTVGSISLLAPDGDRPTPGTRARCNG
jgi:hypothetical protein